MLFEEGSQLVLREHIHAVIQVDVAWIELSLVVEGVIIPCNLDEVVKIIQQ